MRAICSTPHCRKVAAPKKRKCHRCRKRAWRERHPVLDLFFNLRGSAKKRGLEFSVTFEEFERVAVGGGYHFSHGCGNSDTQIDRIDASMGYVSGNITVITGIENRRKGIIEKRLRGIYGDNFGSAVADEWDSMY